MTITYQHNALVRAVVDLVDQLIHPHVHLLLALGRGHPPVGRGSGKRRGEHLHAGLHGLLLSLGRGRPPLLFHLGYVKLGRLFTPRKVLGAREGAKQRRGSRATIGAEGLPYRIAPSKVLLLTCVRLQVEGHPRGGQ